MKALKILLGAYINDEGDVAFECKSLNEINTAVAELSIITSELEALQAPKTCEWVKDRSGEVYELLPVFYTQCGGSFVFSECGIKENKFLFCPFCGGSINEPKEIG